MRARSASGFTLPPCETTSDDRGVSAPLREGLPGRPGLARAGLGLATIAAYGLAGGAAGAGSPGLGASAGGVVGVGAGAGAGAGPPGGGIVTIVGGPPGVAPA